MTPSEESMTLMTSYHFPHHGNRSFAIASGWRLMVFFITAASLRHRFGVTLIVNRHSERTQKCCVRKPGNSNMTPSEESMTLMTSYHFPHHGNRSFAIASGWRLMVFFITAASLRHRFGVTLIVSRHSERWQECCSKKTGNGTVTQSEESMILMTSYRFPHHRYRAFTFASDDV
mgnify:FL=1